MKSPTNVREAEAIGNFTDWEAFMRYNQIGKTTSIYLTNGRMAWDISIVIVILTNTQAKFQGYGASN